jgi:hypothetical protein
VQTNASDAYGRVYSARRRVHQDYGELEEA